VVHYPNFMINISIAYLISTYSLNSPFIIGKYDICLIKSQFKFFSHPALWNSGLVAVSNAMFCNFLSTSLVISQGEVYTTEQHFVNYSKIEDALFINISGQHCGAVSLMCGFIKDGVFEFTRCSFISCCSVRPNSRGGAISSTHTNVNLKRCCGFDCDSPAGRFVSLEGNHRLQMNDTSILMCPKTLTIVGDSIVRTIGTFSFCSSVNFSFNIHESTYRFSLSPTTILSIHTDSMTQYTLFYNTKGGSVISLFSSSMNHSNFDFNCVVVANASIPKGEALIFSKLDTYQAFIDSYFYGINGMFFKPFGISIDYPVSLLFRSCSFENAITLDTRYIRIYTPQDPIPRADIFDRIRQDLYSRCDISIPTPKREDNSLFWLFMVIGGLIILFSIFGIFCYLSLSKKGKMYTELGLRYTLETRIVEDMG